MSVDYKYKPEKHRFRVSNKTLDEFHTEHISQFEKNRKALDASKQLLKQYKDELKQLENREINKPINMDIDYLKKRNTLKKNIDKLNEKIKTIENYKSEMDYYSRAGDVLFDYYDQTNGILYNKEFDTKPTSENNNTSSINQTKTNPLTEQTNTTSSTTASKIAISDELLAITNLNKTRKLKKPVRKRNKKIDLIPNRSIMSYLIKDEDKETEKEESKVCKATLQNEYLMMVDKEYACSKVKTSLIKKCKNPSCKGADKVIIFNESILTCPKCGESDEIFIETDVPSHRETFNEKPKYPYKRKGHCIEKLNQFLCKGTTNVPKEVFDVLNEEVNKHGLAKDEITVQFLEKMLKKHRLADYYEYIMYIYSKMTNTPPQTISREEYETVLKMFEEADEVYEKKYKPKNRNNFLKYTFALNKIFLTINRRDIAKHFKLLKSAVKMKEQEKIWQLICNDKGWTYHSS